jgi:hypothetical protein
VILFRGALRVLIGLTGLVLLVCLWTQGSLLLGSYGEIEARQARWDFDRAATAIRGRVELMETVARDWAAVPRRSPFTAADFEALREVSGADLVFLLDRKGRVDGGNDPETAAAAVATGALDPPSPLVRPPASGLLSTGKGLMILASRSLPGGTILVVGRMLDAEELVLLRKGAGVSLSLIPAEETNLANRPRGVGAFLIDDRPGSLVVSGTLRDLFGHPSLVLAFEKPRGILLEGWAAVRSSGAILILLAGILGTVWAILLRHRVACPLREMILRAERMRRDGALRFSEDRDDGMGDLARALNTLLNGRKEALEVQSELNDLLMDEIRELTRARGASGRRNLSPDRPEGPEGGGKSA